MIDVLLFIGCILGIATIVTLLIQGNRLNKQLKELQK